METYIKLTEVDLSVLEDASIEERLSNMCKNAVAEIRFYREEGHPRTKAVEVLAEAVDGLHNYNLELRKVIETLQVRIAFIGHPKEPVDWSKEIAMVDAVLAKTNAD